MKNNSGLAKGFIFYLCFFVFCDANAQLPADMAASRWVDSVFATLSKEEKIGQLMVVRLSQIDSKTKRVVFFDDNVSSLVKNYNIGGICLFQGAAIEQAKRINYLQAEAKTPLLVCIDAEWGLGMRLTADVRSLPKQMMLGAMRDKTIVYNYGKLVAEQCKRLGIAVNYAPVVDVNNNPNNPVINDRSFGEDKYKVAEFGIAYMKGMQDNMVMATAKHFPGHGDVAVDSHFDLPIIKKSIYQLDTLELYPFKKIFEAGISSVMLAHLSIPAIDNTPNLATSLSAKNISGLLRKNIGYNGLTFTDGLEMQGVQKYYPGAAASVQSIIAGNDMLCLPSDVPGTIKKLKESIKKKKLSWADIDMHCKKVLMAKYQYGLAKIKKIDTSNIVEDLNAGISSMTKTIAENAITLVAKTNNIFYPLEKTGENEIAYLGIGINEDNTFSKRIREEYNAKTLFFDYKNNDVTSMIAKLAKYKKIIIGIHNTSRSSAANFGLSSSAIQLVNKLQAQNNSICFLFANAYALKNFCNSKNMVVCYEDNDIIENVAIDILQGKLGYKGVLPVSVCETYKYGNGITTYGSLLNELKKKFLTQIVAYLNLLTPLPSMLLQVMQCQAA